MPILIVEDDADLLRLMQRLLQLWGMPTLTAVDGFSALELVKSHHPSVIITDYHMPNINGMMLARAVREAGLTVPILLLTADGDWRVDELAREAGIDRVLKKPIHPEMLEQSIRAVWTSTGPSHPPAE